MTWGKGLRSLQHQQIKPLLPPSPAASESSQTSAAWGSLKSKTVDNVTLALCWLWPQRTHSESLRLLGLNPNDQLVNIVNSLGLSLFP